MWLQRLQTEYNTAIRSARMAVNWKKFQETKNTYPNLEYTPSRAANPRDSHRVYWGKIWAIDDPVWDTIIPPSEWNCLCGVRPTNKPVTILPDGWQHPATDPVFRNNPGKTAKIVNTEETGYYQSAPEQKRPIILLFAMNFVKKEGDKVIEKYIGRNGGFLNIVKQGKQEFKDNVGTYKILANNGGQYSLLKEVKEDGKSNPDAINHITGEISDAKHPVTESGRRAIQNSINSAVDQKTVTEVVIRLSHNYSLHSLYKGLALSFEKGKAKKIKTVILIDMHGNTRTISVDELRRRIK